MILILIWTICAIGVMISLLMMFIKPRKVKTYTNGQKQVKQTHTQVSNLDQPIANNIDNKGNTL